MYGHVDQNMILADAQVVGTTAANEASTNQVRLPVRSDNSEFGGGDLYLNIQIDTTFAGGTSIVFSLYDAADNGDVPNTFAATGITRTRTVANNQMDAKKKILSIQLPPGLREWIEVYHTVTGSMTAGKVDEWVSDTPFGKVD